MRADHQNDIASDLAYVRSLAEEGANAPLVSGRFYLIWGLLLAAASLFTYAIAIDVLPFANTAILGAWIAALAIGWSLSIFMRGQMGAMPGAATLGNKTAGDVWRAVGIFMTVFWIALMIAHGRFTAYGVPPYFLFGLMFPVGFGLYGVAFYATATAARADWLRIVAGLSWFFAVATLFLMATSHQFLAGAVGMIVCAVAPGYLLMRAEPKEII